MREKNLFAIAILGVIIGALGLSIGAYSIMQVQTGALKGDDGDDGDDGASGIWLQNSNFNALSGNTIDNIYSGSGEAYGIYEFNSRWTRLTGNLIRNIQGTDGYAAAAKLL